MPKLTIKQQQNKKKLRRHNPIARTIAPALRGTTESVSATATTTTSATSGEQDVIPLINALPLSSTSPGSLQDDENVHRALLCLNPLLLTKASRLALLAPKHLLLHRLLHNLDHHRLEVRKEAAGCLRNLCVEGQWSGREQVFKLGGGSKALAHIEYAAKELKFLPTTDGDLPVAQAVSGASTANTPKKPEEMNRKERRQAAKASKSLGGTTSLSDLGAPIAATPASAAAEVDAHDLQLLHLSLLENHLTIVWCLLETIDSPSWLDQLNKSALGELLCSAISRGAESYREHAPSASKVTQKEQKEIKAAELDVALTAVNVLAAWVEDNPTASACLVGIPADLTEQVVAFEQGGNSSAPGSKSRKRLESILDKFGTVSGKQADHGLKRLNQLASAANLLNSSHMNSPEDVQRLNFGLLALASCSNILTALPSPLRAWIPAPSGATPSAKTLLQWQVSDATPLLLQFLTTVGASKELWIAASRADSTSSQGASKDESEQRLQTETGMDIDVRREDEETQPQDEGEDPPTSSLTTRKVDTMTLAMELLGETCTEAASEIVSLQPGGSVDAMDDSDDMEEDDDAGEREGSEDTLDSEQEEEMLMLTEGDREAGGDDTDELSMSVNMTAASNGATPAKTKNIVSSTKRQWDSPYATLFAQHEISSSILRIISACSGVPSWSGGVSSASLREFILASHNTLASLLSAIASHGQPPPTHPLEVGSRKEREVRLFQRWVVEQASRLGAAWEGLIASSDRVQDILQGTEEEERQWAATLSSPVWTCLHAIVVMHEGLKALPISLAPGANGHSGLDNVFSEPLKTLLSYKGPTAEITSTSQAASLIISTLSYLGRIPSLASSSHQAQPSLLERNQFAADTFLSLLSTYTTSHFTSSSPSTAVEILPLLSILNALIDLYADETAAWDEPIFRKNHLLNRLSNLTRSESEASTGPGTAPGSGNGADNVGGRVMMRERIRSIDKRREESLRSMAQETWENWISWIRYRKGLGDA